MAGQTQSLHDDDDVVATINVAPLVDVMLVLLIIFLVTATFIKDPVIPVKLPRAATGVEANAKSLAVTLDAEGDLFINGHVSTSREVADTLKKALAGEPGLQVIVAADGSLSYARVMDLVNLVKSTGVKEFALNVRRPDGGP